MEQVFRQKLPYIYVHGQYGSTDTPAAFKMVAILSLWNGQKFKMKTTSTANAGFFKHTNNDNGNQNIPKAMALIILGLSVTASKSSMVRFVKKYLIFFTSYICTLFYYDFISSNLDSLFVKTRRKYTRFMTRTKLFCHIIYLCSKIRNFLHA